MRIFWCTGPIGMIQHEDFWDTIAKNVSVYRSDIRNMQPDSIVLQDGSEIKSDVLFCGTGWSQHYPFLAKDQIVEFGLPHVPEVDKNTNESAKWETLLKVADQQVIAQFPQLAHPPPHFERPTKTTATRLYNCIAPLGDKTIAFLGDIYLSNSFRTAEAQAIWVTAYFDGRVELPPREEAEKEIAYMTAFSKRRYPSHGATGNYFHMDLVGYTDKLMKDVGLVSHRGRWWQDLVSPCLASDFKGIREEYLSKFGFQGERNL
jgi:dimethylaniline monooxygenase (N-oxide forming)